MSEQEKPKKISADQVEVIGVQGEVVKEASGSKHAPKSPFGFGQVKVIRGSPWMILLLPVLLPIVLFAFFFIAVFALIFGRGLFKVVGRNVRRN